MSMPARLTQQAGRYSLVDGIPFHLPVSCKGSPVLMAVFTIDPAAARKLIPGNEIFPFRFGSRALLVVTVVDYLNTTIGRYIEFSIAIACTHGSRPAPPFLPALFQVPCLRLIQARHRILEPFQDTGGLEEMPVRRRCHRKAIRDPDPLGGQLPVHFAQGGVLAADLGHVLHPDILEPEYERFGFAHGTTLRKMN